MSHPIHLILSAGTRIVTRNDANRIGGGQLIAAGAVAVITDSPADAQHAYKVRRNEFSILKEFKGIPGNDERREGELRVRLDEERDALLTIKRGERPRPDVNEWRLRLHKEFDEAFASIQLPERPDYNLANEFLLKARRETADRRRS